MRSDRHGKGKQGSFTLYKDIQACLDATNLGPKIDERFEASLLEAGEVQLSKQSISESLQKILSSEKSGWVTISQPLLRIFPPPYNTLDHIRICGTEYLMANLDVLSAWKRGAITSWLDHLLTAGLKETIQGTRSLSLCNLAIKKSDDAILTRPICILVNDGEWFDPDSIKEDLEIFNGCVENIYIYECGLDIATCLANGNELRGLSEVALLASLFSCPIVLVRLGSRPSKWVLDQATSLIDEMDKKVVLYGDYIIKTVDDNETSIVRGRPFTPISLFEVDITHGILVATPISLHGFKQEEVVNRDLAWQEIVTYAYINGAEFRHKQTLFGESTNKSRRSWQIKDEYYDYEFIMDPATSVNGNNFGGEVKRLSQASFDKAIQLIDDGKNSSLVQKLSLSSVTIVISCRDRPDQIKNCIQLLLDRGDIPFLRIVLVIPFESSLNLINTAKQLQSKYGGKISLIHDDKKGNSSSVLNNLAVFDTDSEYILFADQDILLQSDFAISEMLAYKYLYCAGIVGARLFDSAGLIHHDGLAISFSKSIALVSTAKGYFEEHIEAICPVQATIHQCTAVSGAFLLISRDRFLDIGGLSEELNSESSFVDLCLKSNSVGQQTICVTRPTITFAADANCNKFDHLSRSNDVAIKKILVEKHSESFSARDPYSYGELLGSRLSSNAVSHGSISECGKPIRTEEMARWQSDKAPEKCIASIFVHYDATGHVSDNVFYYLNSLTKLSDIYFVSSSIALAENKETLKKLEKICQAVVVRSNSGYDFGCWSHMIQQFKVELMSKYDSLLLCNDSVIGPIHDLRPILESFLESGADFCGLTASTAPEWHMQSYFIMYSKQLILDPIFYTFWSSIREQPTKYAVIESYEVPWSRLLMRHGFTPYVHFNNYLDAENNTHIKWRELVLDGYPFVKNELIRENPLSVSIEGLEEMICGYNPSLAQLITQRPTQ
jgi:hypothetical protein